MLTIVAGLLFVLSSGLLFNERFKRNWALVGLAAAIAIVSSVFLINELPEKLGFAARTTSVGKASISGPTATPAEPHLPLEPAERASVNSLAAANRALKPKTPGLRELIDTDLPATHTDTGPEHGIVSGNPATEPKPIVRW